MKSSFMCFLSCLLISLVVGSDGGKRGQKVTTGDVTWSYLAIQHRQVCLILKTARSFVIVPRIKWIFQSLRFVYNFLPSYWLPECWRERSDRNENDPSEIDSPFPLLSFLVCGSDTESEIMIEYFVRIRYNRTIFKRDEIPLPNRSSRSF